MKNDSVRSSLIELQSFLYSKIDVDPIYCVVMSLPCFMHVLCMTWYTQVDRIRILVILVNRRLCSSGSSPAHHRPVFEAHQGANTFPSACGLTTTSSTDPSASRNTSSVSTITDDNARIGGRSTLSYPYVGLTVHWAVSVRRSTTGRWPSRSRLLSEDDPHPRSDAGRPLEPWVCRHTRKPTVLSRLSCRPPHLNFDRFHQPCLSPWRTHGCCARIGEDCRPRTTWRPLTVFGQPVGSPSFATHWRYCHADWAVPRQDVNSSFLPCVCHISAWKVFAHTQVRDPRECHGDPNPLAIHRQKEYCLSVVQMLTSRYQSRIDDGM